MQIALGLHQGRPQMRLLRSIRLGFIAALLKAKHFVGKNLRRAGIEYSSSASVQMWRERADGFAAHGRRDEALNCRRKAVELAPGNKALRIELVRELALANRSDEIQDPEGWNALGFLLIGIGEHLVDAEQAFRKSIARSPDKLEAFLGLSECLARQQRLAEALAARELWFRRWIEDAESDGVRRRQEAARCRQIPPVMFVAMMKSASEFIRENIMRVLDIPEIGLSMGTIPRDRVIPSAVRQLVKGGAIARAHISADNLSALMANGVQRLILHVRDPRQVIVSWVHYMAGISDAEFRWSASTYDPPVPVEFRDRGFGQQLDWAVRNYMPGQLQWLEDWMVVVNSGPPIPILVSKFEDFAQDQRSFFGRISDFMEVSEIRVPSLPWQSAAAMRNFRMGRFDEWREVLTPSQIAVWEARVEPLARYFGWRLDPRVSWRGKTFAAAES
jgi:Sulfotransferase domain